MFCYIILVSTKLPDYKLTYVAFSKIKAYMGTESGVVPSMYTSSCIHRWVVPTGGTNFNRIN